MDNIYVTEESQLLDMFSVLSASKLVAVDTETTGLNPHSCDLLLISMKGDHGAAYVVDYQKLKHSEALHASMKALLEAPWVKKLIHNAPFDWMFLYHYFGAATFNMHCTLVSEQLLTAGLRLPCDLASIVERRCGATLDKRVRSEFLDHDGIVTERQIDYAAADVLHLHTIYLQQMRELEQEDMLYVYGQIEMPLLAVTARMMYRGIAFDIEQLRAATPVFERRLAEADLAIQDYVIQHGQAKTILFETDRYSAINSASVQQMLSVANAVGINIKTMAQKDLVEWDDKYAETVDGDEEDLIIGFTHPFLRLHAERIALQKLLSTYLRGLEQAVNPVTGRIHPGFNQCGAVATGRYSSSAPNWQNLPQNNKLKLLGLGEYDIRSMFKASDGRKLIIADYSAMELIILAGFSNDKNLLHQISQGDIHSIVATQLFGIEVTKKLADQEPYKTYRQEAKRITYAIMYGTTGRNLYRTCSGPLAKVGFHMTPQDGDMFIRAWKALFPDTGAFLDASAEHAVVNGYVTTIAGRRRHWNKNWFHMHKMLLAAMREGPNARIQGSNADATKLAMVMLAERMDWNRGWIIGTVHDEIINEADEAYAEELAELTRWCMETAGNMLFPDLPVGYIKADPKISSVYDK